MKNLFFTFIFVLVLQNFVFANSSTYYTQSASENSMFHSSSVNTNYGSSKTENLNSNIQPQYFSNIQQIKREYPTYSYRKTSYPKTSYPKNNYSSYKYPKYNQSNISTPSFRSSYPSIKYNTYYGTRYVYPIKSYKNINRRGHYNTHTSPRRKSIKNTSSPLKNNCRSYGTYSKNTYSHSCNKYSYPKPTYSKYRSNSQYGKYSSTSKKSTISKTQSYSFPKK